MKKIYTGMMAIVLIGLLLLSGCKKPLPTSYSLVRVKGDFWECRAVKTDAIQFSTFDMCWDECLSKYGEDNCLRPHSILIQ